MAENSSIQWTDHTFNPWIGCTKISPACDNCYAELYDNRFSKQSRWGSKAARTRTKNWGYPKKWNAIAQHLGVRNKVFCASLADVFDNHPSIDRSWREDLWSLIRQTEHLDWLLLTKRPQNITKFLPHDWSEGYKNVWLGTTVENQTEYDRRVPVLSDIPAGKRFLSMEPLIGPVTLSKPEKINWIIVGGESGSSFRPMNPQWVRHIRNQCKTNNIHFFFKQWSGRNQLALKGLGRELDGLIYDERP